MRRDPVKRKIQRALREIRDELKDSSEEERLRAINEIRLRLHDLSPRSTEPVDCVRWVSIDKVIANDYNPNAVAPPEMQLLEHSVQEDGYTQPIVAWEREDGMFEVVDGFHRNRVGRESDAIRGRLGGYLPVTVINEARQDRGDRIAATIRHNRARGKHRVDAMSDIVVELKRRNWSDNKIAKELGMDQDEVLRLCQITGLADLFADQEFSRAWDVEGFVTEDDFRGLTEEDVAMNGNGHRTVNTSDPDRIFHRHEDWECFRAGFYASTKTGVSQEQGEEMYRVFLSDLEKFEDALGHVVLEWKHSCEHYLTNVAMNRIAWLGQAAMCYATGIPAAYRAGFSLLTEEQQEAANQLALEYLNYWLEAHRRKPVTMEEAYSYDRQSDIY